MERVVRRTWGTAVMAVAVPIPHLSRLLYMSVLGGPDVEHGDECCEDHPQRKWVADKKCPPESLKQPLVST